MVILHISTFLTKQSSYSGSVKVDEKKESFIKKVCWCRIFCQSFFDSLGEEEVATLLFLEELLQSIFLWWCGDLEYEEQEGESLSQAGKQCCHRGLSDIACWTE